MVNSIVITDDGVAAIGKPAAVSAIVNPQEDRYYLGMTGKYIKKDELRYQVRDGFFMAIAGSAVGLALMMFSWTYGLAALADLLIAPFRKDRNLTFLIRIDKFVDDLDSLLKDE